MVRRAAAGAHHPSLSDARRRVPATYTVDPMHVDSNPVLAAYPAGFHENDQFRSTFMRHLMLMSPQAYDLSPAPCSTIPKVLVRFWDAADAVPDDVQACLGTWEPLRADGFDLLIFNDESAAAYIEDRFGRRQVEAFHQCRHPAMRSDYFRLCYILASGGFYVDADDVLTHARWPLVYQDDRLKLQPLCYDIPSTQMVPTSELWHAGPSDDNRIFYVNNNPLVAPPNHPVVRDALQRATRALLSSERSNDIQSMTGPGNLTAALAAHARELALAGKPRDFELMRFWDEIADTRWELSYRADERNWRHMNRKE